MIYSKRAHLAVVLLLSTVLIVACTASQIESYINLAAQIATNVLQISSAFGTPPVSEHDTQLIATFQHILQSSVTAFEANKTAGNSALVSVAMAAESNIPAFLAAAQFENPALAARVEAASTAFLTIVESIAASMPNAPSAPVASVGLKSGRVYKLPMRVKVPRQNILNEWNSIVCQGASSACMAK